MYYGLKQGQITPNIDNKYVLKLISLVVQCSKITNKVFFVYFKNAFYIIFPFLLLSTSNVRMSEGTFCRVEVHILSTHTTGSYPGRGGCPRFFFFFFFF